VRAGDALAAADRSCCHAIGDRHAHAPSLHRDRDRDGHAHAHRDPAPCRRDRDAGANADAAAAATAADTHAHPIAYTCAHAIRQSDAAADAIGHRDGHRGNGNSHCYNQTNGHEHADRNARRDEHAHPGADRNAHADHDRANRHPHRDLHAHPHINADHQDYAPETMNTLYVTGTPLGNLEDITLRALRILKEASLIAAEDTRKTRILLDRYDIHTPLTSYFEHNKLAKIDAILTALEQGDVALVSEAGMPGLSDPGYELIREALARGINLVVVPGPAAVVSALVVSGLPTDQFIYLGFLPRKSGERVRLFEEFARARRTLVAYEAPHRLLESLRDAHGVLGERPVAIARELTKLHEEVFRGMLSEAIAHFEAQAPRGEFTLVIGGAEEGSAAWDQAAVRTALAAQAQAGASSQDAIRQVTEASGWRRREVYALWLAVSKESPNDPPDSV
jgi:16S rRNA (cytidine1402-2'-O)-methyltransferase